MNRLADETSPYLRQHAANPVEWYPWGPDAFAAAKLRDVPILLSIGYSACHWCHVMAHESFEDEPTAAVMNAGFVAVKVDREERPDVDAVYMEAVQALTGGGGWPMTVFLLPDGRPFLGGTYYPRERFVDLLQQVGRAWRERRHDIEEAAAQLSAAVRAGTGVPRPSSDVDLPAGDLLGQAADALMARFDPDWGGFGSAPKFPQPSMLEMLMLAAARTGRADLVDALNTTLDAMAAGGIYDHLGGGFARYSTDRTWLVPHFEKMLYDNALLTRAYLHAWQLTGLDRHRQVVHETIEYLLRPPMRLPGAGFASAEDADSEGVEGLFYTWDRDEFIEAGGAAAKGWYGVTPGGNWEGRSILHRPERGALARPSEVEDARRRLFERRETRVRPGLDDKALAEWNAMAVAAIAEAGAALDEPRWVLEAEQVAGFMVDSMRRRDGRWLRSWQADGGARHLAYAADHAWLVEAFCRLYEATGQPAWVRTACDTADALIELFFDNELGVFRTSGSDAEALIARPVETHDGALPSANSVACSALLRLGALTGEERYSSIARTVLGSMRPALVAYPVPFSGMVFASELDSAGLWEIVVTGSRPDLLHALRRRYLPGVVLAWGEPFDSPLWEGRAAPDREGLAFVCQGHTCLEPVSDPDRLDALVRT